MLDLRAHQGLAEELNRAERRRTQIEQFSRWFPALTIAGSISVKFV